ncbi:MAG: lamin tail domain-containing protein, partial [Bacteroidota bacterium]
LDSVQINSDSGYTTFTLKGTVTSDSGYIRVAGNNTAGQNYIWIDNLVFDNDSPAPIDPLPVAASNPAPADNDLSVFPSAAMKVTLGWEYHHDNAYTEPDSFKVLFDTDSSFGTAVVFKIAHTSGNSDYNSSIEVDVAYSTDYYWKVIPFNVSGDAASYGTWTFKTVDGPQLPKIFFSEYIEGSSNNKAIEIYNGNGSDVDLSEFRVIRANNGALTLSDSLVLSGTLVAGDVFVIGNSSAVAAILDVSDITSTLTYFNGDDFMGLQYNNAGVWETIDVVGLLGEDPGAAWKVAGVLDATANHTLVRKETVTSGNTDWAASADTTTEGSEWIVYDQDNFDYIGLHPGTNVVQIPKIFFSEYIEGSSNNKGLEIYNGGDAEVDLTKLVILQGTNGGYWAYAHAFPAGATLAAGDVWVIVADQVNSALYDTTKANEVLSYPSVTHHNGDDARAIAMIVGTDTTLIDVIGLVDGIDPGTGWPVAGIADATANHTLVRKETVIVGNADWTASAGTNADDSEWIVWDQNDFTNLGSHPYIPPIDSLATLASIPAPTNGDLAVQPNENAKIKLGWGYHHNAAYVEPDSFKVLFAENDSLTNAAVYKVAHVSGNSDYYQKIEVTVEYGKTYYWKVIPFNSTGEAVGAELWTFTTIDQPIPSNDLNLTFEDTADVSNWSHWDEANLYTTEALNDTAGVNKSGALELGDGGYGFIAKRKITATSGHDFRLKVDIKTLGWNNPGTYPLYLFVQGFTTTDSVLINSDSAFTTFTLEGRTSSDSGYVRIAGVNTLGQNYVWVDNLFFDDSAYIEPVIPFATIAQIQTSVDTTDVSPYKGLKVKTSGIVTGVRSNGYYLQDGDGAWNGVWTYDPTNKPARGDEVELTAKVDEYYGLTELLDVVAFEVTSSGNPAPIPVLLSTLDANQEQWEGVLVKVEKAVVTNANLGNGEWMIDDGSGQVIVDDYMYKFTPDSGKTYNVTGIGHYSFNNYKIEPRDSADIIIILPDPKILYALEHTPGDLSVSVINNGRIGQITGLGNGVNWKGQNGIWRGSILLGTNGRGKAVGAAHNNSPDFADMVSLTAEFLDGIQTEGDFEQVTKATFTDSLASNPYYLEVKQHTYSKTGEEVVFFRYGITNTTESNVEGVHVGMFLDWDVDGDNYTKNKGGVSEAEHLVYVYGSVSPHYYGAVALNGLNGAKVTGNNDEDVEVLRTSCFNYISTLDTNPWTTDGDMRSYLGSYVGDIPIGETKWVTFAIVAGDNLQMIRDNANNAFILAKAEGWTDITVDVDDLAGIPQTYDLAQNYPNPFNPSTTIRFALPFDSNVKIKVYNLLGQEVNTLLDNAKSAGYHELKWNASDLASGVYFYSIEATAVDNSKSYNSVKKMMLLK